MSKPKKDILTKGQDPYLDDIVFFPVENAKVVQEIGYSRIWRVMEVRTAEENGGEHVALYENVSHERFEEFRDAADVDEYYIMNLLKQNMLT